MFNVSSHQSWANNSMLKQGRCSRRDSFPMLSTIAWWYRREIGTKGPRGWSMRQTIVRVIMIQIPKYKSSLIMNIVCQCKKYYCQRKDLIQNSNRNRTKGLRTFSKLTSSTQMGQRRDAWVPIRTKISWYRSTRKTPCTKLEDSNSTHQKVKSYFTRYKTQCR